MITFSQWAETENKDIALPELTEKSIRTVSSFPGIKGYPPETAAPNGDDSIYPPLYSAARSPTGSLAVELGRKKSKKK
jgi:hypothetical protein